MTERDDARIGHVVRHGARRRLEASGPHLSEDLIVAHLDGELSGEVAEQALEHLAACPECATATLEMNEFLQPVDPAADRFQELRAGDWQRLRSGLAAQRASAGSEVSGGLSRRWLGRGLESWSMLSTLAAAAMVVVVVRGHGELTALREANQTLAHEVTTGQEALERLKAGVWANDVVLEPRRFDSRSGGEAPVTVRLEEGQGLVLLLTPETRTRFADYRIEVRDEDEDLVVALEGLLPRSLQHQFTVRVPKSRLPAGRYGAELFGLLEGEWAPIGRTLFEVEP